MFKKKKRVSEGDGHVFQEKWKSVSFSVERDKIACSICSNAVSAPKECNLPHNDEILHKDKFGVLEGELKEDNERISNVIFRAKEYTFCCS
jgi:hypothetical protein